MSSVFKQPKVKTVSQKVVEPETVNNNEVILQLEKKRKKKMGALSQLVSEDRNAFTSYNEGKRTLGA